MNAFLKIYEKITPEFIDKTLGIAGIFNKNIENNNFITKEKFANFKSLDFSNSKVIMFHGASVGEVLSLENLVKETKKTFADYKIVITTSTKTGQEIAKKKYSEISDFICFFPYDTKKTVEKFLDKINPSVILIAETELWPNFFFSAKKRNIPLYIINARLSDKSYPNYLRFKGFIKKVLDATEGIFCQSELDKTRYEALGAGNVRVMKNLKFKIEKQKNDIDLKNQGFKTIIAASLHAGEEEIILNVFKKLLKKDNTLKLIIAPRHLSRLDEVKKMCSEYKTGLKTNGDDFSNCDIIILDTMGELSKIYDIADAAFIGGSLNKDKTGGHNPLEATVYSKPVISGNSIKNFRDIYAILEREGAAFIVKNEKELYEYLFKLLFDIEFYKKTSLNCKKCFEGQQGGLEFVINQLKRVLK